MGMPPVMCNDEYPEDYRVKTKKKIKLRTNTRRSYQTSAKGRSASTIDKTPRRSRKKSNNRGQAVQRIDVKGNPSESKNLNNYDLPTVLPDYSLQYENGNQKLGLKSEASRLRRIHRPWYSPSKDTSDSDMSGSGNGCTGPVLTGCCGIRPVLEASSPILLQPGDPTPSGLYGYTPLGFNGFLRYTFKCVYCSKLFKTAGSLYGHCNDHHYGDNPYEFPFCKERFLYSIHYAEHLNEHILTKSFPTYRCEVCPIGFCSEWELKLHSTTHTFSSNV